jgi:ribulose-5-phosphate 4-epimerase/fuculose-1-phosphate aldolase
MESYAEAAGRAQASGGDFCPATFYDGGMTVSSSMAHKERDIRVALAACYRLVALFKWDDLIFTHITAKVPGPEDHFLINPYGWLFDEITASSLVKVDLAGRKVDDSAHDINPAGFVIHSAIHAARPDAHCILHIHSLAGVAVSTRREGLRPISQHSLLPLTSLAYHDYEGIAVRDDEKPRLVSDLGDKKFLILRNHGLLTIGASVPEAFVGMYFLETACRIQTLAESAGKELISISADVLQGTRAAMKAATRGIGADLAWPGLLRRLDRVDPSYRE